jgi:potassium channel subfamily K
MTFALSFGAWLVLLFGGAAVFMICERPSQGWSYFDGVYMAFISLTTVGYGDLTPTSSSGRSFFVLWSLLSVPTITISISHAEETLLRIVRDITIFVGGITILPSHGGLGQQVKRKLRALGLRDGCPAHHDRHVEVEMEQNLARELPATRTDYCSIILDEIIGIIRHLGEQPLQNYSFDQWLWFRKLIEGLESILGEEHRQSREQEEESGRQEHMTAEGISPLVLGPQSPGLDIFKFSEVISKSPLMGPKEEAEWFLERLVEALKQQLGRMER